MPLRSWPALALALALLAAGPTRAEEASAHGVSVTVPPGYRWLQDPPKKPPSTIIYLQEEGGGAHPAVILVNHVVASAGMDEQSVFAGYEEYADAPGDAQVVELPGGRFMRVDFSVPMRDGRTVRQRVYAALRGKHQYSFFLANLEAEAFARHLPAFDALVGGARFGEPTPTPPPVAARPEPPKPAEPPAAQPKPEPPKPAEPPPQPKPPEARPQPPAQPRPEPKPPEARPQPPAPRPEPPKPGEARPQPPAQPKPEPSRPPEARPEPQAQPPAQPPSQPKPEPARPAEPPAQPKPEPRPTEPKPEPRPRPAAAGQELLRTATLARFDSEYDATLWAAAHLIDGRVDRGWCSSPRARAPHRFVFALERSARLAKLAFDNACPEEEGFEGVSAAGFAVEVSTDGQDGPYRPALEGTLLRGKNDQVFELQPPVEARWVRLTIRSNHGHPTLTELMGVRAYAAGEAGPATSAGEFHLDRVRASRAKNGPPLEGEAAFQAGERVWINVKPRGLSVGPEEKAWLEIDLVLEDAQGRELLRRDRVVDHVARPPAPPLTPFVSLHLDLPRDFPPGPYAVRLLARDRIAQTSAAAVCPFTVR